MVAQFERGQTFKPKDASRFTFTANLRLHHWVPEQEYRWFITDQSSNDFFVSMQDSLVGILLEDRSSTALKHAAGTFAKEHDVRVAIMYWRNGFPQPSPVHWRQLLTPEP